MKIQALHNGKVYEVVGQEQYFYIVSGPTLNIPIRLSKEHCIVVDDNTELTRLV